MLLLFCWYTCVTNKNATIIQKCHTVRCHGNSGSILVEYRVVGRPLYFHSITSSLTVNRSCLNFILLPFTSCSSLLCELSMRDVILRIDPMKYSIRFNDRTAFELYYCHLHFVQLHCDAKFQPVVHCEYIDQSQCEKQTMRNQMRKCY